MGGVLSQGTRKQIYILLSLQENRHMWTKINDKKPGKIDGNGLGVSLVDGEGEGFTSYF